MQRDIFSKWTNLDIYHWNNCKECLKINYICIHRHIYADTVTMRYLSILHNLWPEESISIILSGLLNNTGHKNIQYSLHEAWCS